MENQNGYNHGFQARQLVLLINHDGVSYAVYCICCSCLRNLGIDDAVLTSTLCPLPITLIQVKLLYKRATLHTRPLTGPKGCVHGPGAFGTFPSEKSCRSPRATVLLPRSSSNSEKNKQTCSNDKLRCGSIKCPFLPQCSAKCTSGSSWKFQLSIFRMSCVLKSGFESS